MLYVCVEPVIAMLDMVDLDVEFSLRMLCGKGGGNLLGDIDPSFLPFMDGMTSCAH